MTAELCDLTGSELAAKIAGGEVSATEVVDSSLRRTGGRVRHSFRSRGSPSR